MKTNPLKKLKSIFNLTSLNHILEGIKIANSPVSQGLNAYLAMSITDIFKDTKMFLSSVLLHQGETKIEPTATLPEAKTFCIPPVGMYRLTSIVLKNYRKKLTTSGQVETVPMLFMLTDFIVKKMTTLNENNGI